VGGSQCFIQNYYDHKQGPGRKDYACGRLSYDGHDGTDFRLRNYPAMREGTAVLAAAPGKVLRTRDGMPDINVNKIDPELIQDRKAGNGVVIEHGDGWVTQYSHLRQGSVQVEPGQKVEQGDELGLIGLSGNTEFPHVEFSVRYKGEEIDPFVGRPGFQGCGNTTDSLWTEAALKEMEYQATGLLSAGFAGQVPQADKARQGVYSPPGMSSRALVFWVDLFGVHKGDEQQIRIAGPDGDQLVNSSEVLKKSNVSWFAYSGLRRPNAGWQQGVYKAVYELKRDGETRVRVSRKCNLK
jgi:murein DD-endopeptidase MepM/ murein hydrolase activator NlpD